MVIRKARLDDAEKLMTMLVELDKQTPFTVYEPCERNYSPINLQAYISKLLKTNSLLLLVEVDEKIVGYLVAERGIQLRTRHSANIIIGILNDYQGSGLGTELLSNLEPWSRTIGVTRLELSVMHINSRAIHLYEKLGFKHEGTNYNTLLINGEYVHTYRMGKLSSQGDE